jgi:Ca2+-binding EF-hand superfamily protein
MAEIHLYIIRKITPPDYLDRKKAFSRFEQPGTGYIKLSNIFNVFECLGIDAPKEEVEQVSI